MSPRNTELLQFKRKSNILGFYYIFLNYVMIALLALSTLLLYSILSITFFIPIYLVISIILASSWRRFEILVHEASHNNVFKTKSFNRKFEFLFSYPVFLDVNTYCMLHGQHHRLIGDFNSDPDLLIYEKWGLHDLPNNKRWVMIIRPLSLYFSLEFFKVTFKNFWVKKKKRINKVIFWMLIVTCIALTNSWSQVGLIYGIPFFVVLPILRFYARANEHTGVDFSDNELNARNNLGLFNRYVLHPYGDAYHQIHHLYPNIPFYNLSTAHKYLVNKKNKVFLDSHSIYETWVSTLRGSMSNK
ncbi:fatty acid desaturase [Fulvivirga sp. 29W222]|uniref:Fatty acid desaturase n=1 Tax=Fulvivirga marina TaxID=2494733 RepID=A0A937KCI9_9BACT|nr:fatty acid desaturase [Fulvivirga marina]MBL6447572.1 fatty acid desaturase [Fulvivirga marina]